MREFGYCRRNRRRCIDVEQGEQGGDGFFKNLKNVFKTGKKLAFGPAGTAISNLIPDSDPNARPLYPGEVHTILKLPNGRLGRANFMGPGTHLVDRLKRGDPPRTFSDKEAMAHDARYALSRDNSDVRRADNKMIDIMRRAQRDNLDSRFNTDQGLNLIQAKTKIEDITGKPLVKFGGIDDKDRPLVQKTLDELEKQGFGDPAQRLRKKLLKRKMTKKPIDNLVRASNNDMYGGANIFNLLSEKLSKLLLPFAKKAIKSQIHPTLASKF